MPRFHNINGVNVQFTEEEESLRDAEEAAWEAGKNQRGSKEPTEHEILLKALELKAGVTEQDKETAKQELMGDQ